jgi:hypothetical protein
MAGPFVLALLEGRYPLAIGKPCHVLQSRLSDPLI